jgi:uncharacterized RDD family membrane protein YckC
MDDPQWYFGSVWTKSLDGSPVTPYGAITAPWWKRVVALAIDNLLLYVVTVLITVGSRSSSSVSGLRLFAELALTFCYFGYLNGVPGQTVGKRLLAIRCVDADTGEAIGFRRGLARQFVVFVLGVAFLFPLFLDGLWPLWDQKRQAWHDKVVRSVVIAS